MGGLKYIISKTEIKSNIIENNRLFITTGGIALISPRENKAPIQFCNNNTFTN
jgi:hypothetical protein